MLNAKAFAHAVTIVTVVFYLICWVLSTVAPDLILGLATSWGHTLNLEAIKSLAPMTITSAIYGLVSISVLAWLTTYAMIWLYTKLVKRG